MPVVIEKKKAVSLNGILAAAKKLSAEERQILRIKLFSDDILKEAKAFDAFMKKRKPLIKKTDEEIVKAIKKIRSKNATQ
jgi:hypothetical protein